MLPRRPLPLMPLSTPYLSHTVKKKGAVRTDLHVLPTQVPVIGKRSSVSGWTNLGPVTSLWTPPASCYLTTTSYSGSLYIYDHFTGSRISSISCNPPILWLPAPTNNSLELLGPATWTSRYYSPAICPSGWSTASDLSPSWQTESGNSAEANTAFLCCPTGYAAPTNTLQPCVSYLSSGATLSNVWAEPTASGQVLIGSSSVLAPQVVSAPQRVDALPLVVLWQETDTEILALLSSISAQATSPPSSTPQPSAHLSAATKGGVAAGIVIVFLLIVLGIFCAFRRRSVPETSDSETDTRRSKANEQITPSPRSQLEQQRRYTAHTQQTRDSGAWSIPAFPVPPASPHGLHTGPNSPTSPIPDERSRISVRTAELATRHNVPCVDISSLYANNDNNNSNNDYSSIPLHSLKIERYEPSTNSNMLSPVSEDTGEQLTPTTYVPPGSRNFSRESTAVGSVGSRSAPSSQRDRDRDSMTLGSSMEPNLYPSPLEFRGPGDSSREAGGGRRG